MSWNEQGRGCLVHLPTALSGEAAAQLTRVLDDFINAIENACAAEIKEYESACRPDTLCGYCGYTPENDDIDF